MQISSSTYQRLYIIDRAIRTIMRVCGGVLLLVMVAEVLPTQHKKLFAYAIFVTLGIICLLAILRICLSPFVKSDEEEEFEQKVDYILQKKQEVVHQTLPETYTPLRNLTAEQQERVRQLLRDLPSHLKKPDAINMAMQAYYLTALEELGYADLIDKHSLRLWLAQITGKQVPDTSQFNDAIPSGAKTKIANARKKIEKILR